MKKKLRKHAKCIKFVVVILIFIVIILSIYLSNQNLPEKQQGCLKHYPSNDRIQLINGTKRIYYGTGHTNSQGMNNIQEFTLSKQANVSIRIALFDNLCTDPLQFSLGSLLQEIIPKSEVLNYCVSSPEEALTRYYETEKFKPDVIIYNVGVCEKPENLKKAVTEMKNTSFVVAIAWDQKTNSSKLKELLREKQVMFLDNQPYLTANKIHYRNQSFMLDENRYTTAGNGVQATGIKLLLEKAEKINQSPDYFFANFDEFLILVPEDFPYESDIQVIYPFKEYSKKK